MNAITSRAASVVIGVAAALVIVAVAIAPFLTPAWVAFEQDRSQAAAWTGFDATDLRAATDSILADLVVGPPDFDVQVGGRNVLDDREREHMRDVRSVFMALWVAAAASALVLVVVASRGRGGRDGSVAWRAMSRGATGLAIGIVGLGVVAVVAFDTLFEVFHEIFFPAGSFTFDPRTERLVQLFPFQFWQDSALAVGFVILVLAVVVRTIARRRGSRPSPAAVREPAAAVTAPG